MIVATTAVGLFPVDGIQAELEYLAKLATTVLNAHFNDNGLCAVCGCTFPCQSAILAEHSIALL